jgi:hypothetical protein
MKTWLAGSVIAASVLTSCGGDALAPRAARDLAAGYDVLVTAVEAGDRVEARRYLRQLVRTVGELESAGAIDPGRADAILAAADDVSGDLRLLPAPSPSVAPSPSPEPATPVPSNGGGEGDDERNDDEDDDGDGAPGNSGGKGNGEGRGKGEAKGHDEG